MPFKTKEACARRARELNLQLDKLNDYSLDQIMPGTCATFNEYAKVGCYVTQQLAKLVANLPPLLDDDSVMPPNIRSMLGSETVIRATSNERSVFVGKNGKTVTISRRTTDDGTAVYKVCEFSEKRTVEDYHERLGHDNL